MSSFIFLLDNADNIHDLVIGTKMERICNNVFKNFEQTFIVKIYPSSEHARVETNNLIKLENVKKVSKIIYFDISEKFSYAIIAMVKGRDLFNMIYENDYKYDEKLTKKIFKQLLKIVSKIHKKNIIHKDIKPENIIYDSETEKITLIDFENKHTLEFASPEQLSSTNITNKVDSWGIGCTLYNFVFGYTPFGRNKKKILTKKPAYEKWIPNNLRDVFDGLLDKDASSRLSVQDALEMDFFI